MTLDDRASHNSTAAEKIFVAAGCRNRKAALDKASSKPVEENGNEYS
ncbi:hypothetical protein [Rhizobium sp. K102]|jgi:hypothetical protein|nr:hypothetical protein [Rhizobium sp. K102]ULR46673.1 hypothetical protein MHI61_16625 [Rhizobium sp. K102]